MHIVLWSLIIAVGLNLILFIPAFLLQTDKLTDLSYSLTFIILATFGLAYSKLELIDYVVFGLVLVWALRLGTFLFIRILAQGQDTRFNEMRKKWPAFIRFWFFQGLTVFLIILPGLLVWQNHKRPSSLVYVGIFIWALGLAIEAFADYQKFKFKQAGKKDWIDEGLWQISRHPNYLGEITVWVGFYVVSVAALAGFSIVTALVSPAYIALILLRFSGVPLLEKSANQRWGANDRYKKYKSEVPVLIPSLSSLKRALR